MTEQLKNQGWITVDANPAYRADYILEVPPLPDLEDVSVVRALHFWEHLYLWQAEELAAEIFKVLEPGGKLILEMPNLWRLCQFVLAGETDPRKTLWGIFGAQGDPKWRGNVFQAHKWGYTPALIQTQLYEAGFQTIVVDRPHFRMPDRDMRVMATKHV